MCVHVCVRCVQVLGMRSVLGHTLAAHARMCADGASDFAESALEPDHFAQVCVRASACAVVCVCVRFARA